ncbi:MAG: hypothetical protein DI582_01495 [Azospirillum brasilense]|nr:MAG: hypothetical protein DI582_01495 [Azospirillum brasilense]
MELAHRSTGTHQRAFSLVELSIVLVILGLLTGGILGGQSLIRAAELRSVTADFKRLHTAVFTYRDKYLELPGDHSRAFDFFSTNCGATAVACNGNGNGLIGDVLNGQTHGEGYMAVKHLALAGLIEGSYTGLPSTPAVPGGNVIASRINSAVFWLWFFKEGTYFQNGCCTTDTTAQYNWIHFGAIVPAGTWPSNYSLKPEEAWNIDTKIDDGKPGTGLLFGPSRDTLCSDNDDRNIAAYDLARTGTICRLGMKI